MGQWRALEEVVLIDKAEYHFAVEEFRCKEDQMVFLHLTVHQWTPAVYKEILRNWKLFRECVTCPLYAVGDDKHPATWERFVSRLGFKPLMNVVCENGVERRLFIHLKEKQDEFIHTEHRRHDERYEQFCHEPMVCPAAVSDAGIRTGRDG